MRTTLELGLLGSESGTSRYPQQGADIGEKLLAPEPYLVLYIDSALPKPWNIDMMAVMTYRYIITPPYRDYGITMQIGH